MAIATQRILEKQVLIGGEWQEAAGGDRFEVHSPGDGSLIGTVPSCTEEDVRAAIDAAREGQKALAKLSVKRRAEMLWAASRIAERRAEEDAVLLCREVGKTIREARDEISVYSNPHYVEAAEGIKRFRGVINPSTQEDSNDKRLLITHEPIGVVGVISPWNWPGDIPNIAASHALAAGDAVILKPASTTPFSAIVLAEIYQEAGFPPGSISVLTGPGTTVGAELVRNPGTNAISFTGEIATGEYLTTIAGIKRLLLEMGGNGPLVIMDDANVDAAVDAAVTGCFYLAGQVCTASERILVHHAVHDEFVDKLVARAKALRVGDPLDESTDMGPLNNQANAEKVQRHIDDAKARGGRFLAGGGSDGLYFEPAVIDDVTPDFLMAREETFGPVAPIMSFGSVDEAIEIANDGPYGLQGAAFTSSLRTAFLLGEGIKCGTVLINETNNYWDQLAPFGGMKKSGLGRELSDWILGELTEVKQISIDIAKVRS